MGSELIGFDHQPRTRVVFGPDTVDRTGEIARSLGGRRALVVTDPHIVEAGHAERVRRSLADEGLSVSIFDAVVENPTTAEVDQCVQAARDAGADLLVGLGGGSSLDTAKGCNFVLTNGGRMQDYWGVGKATRPMLPLIAIPTTAGTGSECQSFALIADAATHQKMACGDPKAAAAAAVLDPMLTVTQPFDVTLCTGMDTIAHAVESAVTRRRNELSGIYSREAFILAEENLPRVLEAPEDLTARGRMLLAAAYAGTAIENSMLGAAHAAANPLTAHYGIVHGQAVGLMLPHVVELNAGEASAAGIYRALAVAAGLARPTDDVSRAVHVLVGRLHELIETGRWPTGLAEKGVAPERLPDLAEEAAMQWTAGFNPRALTPDDFSSLYAAAMAPRAAASQPEQRSA